MGRDVFEQLRRDTIGGGGAHHDVDRAEMSFGFGGDARSLRRIQRAAGKEVHIGAEIRQRFRRRLAAFGVAADDHDPGHTGFGEGLGGGESDTGGAADDQGTGLAKRLGRGELILGGHGFSVQRVVRQTT